MLMLRIMGGRNDSLRPFVFTAESRLLNVKIPIASPPALVDQLLQFIDLGVRQFLSGRECGKECRKRAGESLLHKLLALHSIEILLGNQRGNCAVIVLEDASLAEKLSEITRLSVGTNPRSLKRLTNTLALISIIYEEQKGDGANVASSLDKLVNYALVCVQIAYPYIYNQLSEEPDFKNWNSKIASKLKLRPLTEEETERLNATEEFDEEWEKIVFRMCQKETYLSNRSFYVSALLNKIAEFINNDDQLGDIIEATLEMSAVTNLKAFDTPKKVKANQRNYDKFAVNGSGRYGKARMVESVILKYVDMHPDVTAEQLKVVFPDHLQGGMGVVRALTDNVRDPKRWYKHTLPNGEGYFILAGWADNIHKFIAHVNKNIDGIKITSVE